jgi:hypothetical protein
VVSPPLPTKPLVRTSVGASPPPLPPRTNARVEQVWSNSTTPGPVNFDIIVYVYDPSGKEIASVQGTGSVSAGNSTTWTPPGPIVLDGATLWHLVPTPAVYSLGAFISVAGAAVSWVSWWPHPSAQGALSGVQQPLPPSVATPLLPQVHPLGLVCTCVMVMVCKECMVCTVCVVCVDAGVPVDSDQVNFGIRRTRWDAATVRCPPLSPLPPCLTFMCAASTHPPSHPLPAH